MSKISSSRFFASMQVHGEYEDGMDLVTFGQSKDHRPDLKQFMIYLMTSRDGDVSQKWLLVFSE
ncbi:MAG: hypothetical protein QRY72_02750 [Candidatus Rhabdochlamydia sp.]